VTRLLLVLALPISFAAKAGTLVFATNLHMTARSTPTTLLQEALGQAQLGLKSEDFKQLEVKESLLGRHYSYQQMLNGLPVENALVTISVDHKGEAYKLYHSLVTVAQKAASPAVPLLSAEQAMELAWDLLAIDGELTALPTARLVFDQDLRLTYKILLAVSSPSAGMEVTIDARTGALIENVAATLPRMKRELTAKPRATKRAFATLAEARASFAEKNPKSLLAVALTAKGTAQVFNPNPVASLNRDDLQDTTPSRDFTSAYRTTDLLDITFSNGVYSLQGPKIKLIDFEAPRVAPATSTDGHWVFERQNLAFMDAMTYHHIDQSMRYIESLGFVGSKAVFSSPLEADANGVNGDDNSYYFPAQRRLSFGHGCVNDNEDSEVILHELGHAIHHHINPRWYAGDSGAMGEGFGDYWGASYSAEMEPAMDEKIMNWAFKWDGHNNCWPGRRLNATNLRYQAGRNYAAHGQVSGGVADEIWSTPLFQAFLELHRERQVARGDIDKIILEAQFGLGYALSMPDMARSIMQTAKRLYPNQDFDQVYLKHFKIQGILP